MKGKDAPIDLLYETLLRTLEYAVNELYNTPLEILRKAQPSMEDIGNLCRLFMDIVEGHKDYAHMLEAIEVVGQAADAVREGDNRNLIDCAYHLQDFLERIREAQA